MTISAISDCDGFKLAMRGQWDEAATGWDAHGPQIRAWLGGPTEAMLQMAGVAPGMEVLDVAAGAGDQTLAVAARVGPAGRVLASDISPRIAALAQRNAASAGHHNVAVHVADAEALGLETGRFDAAVCRLGLMFLPNPAGGLGQIARVLKPGAAFCAMVFTGPQGNPCLRILMATARGHAGLAPGDPWTPGSLTSLGKPGLLEALMRDAGFRDVVTTVMPAPFRMATAGDYLAFVRTSAGPIQAILAGLDAAARAAAWADMEAQLGTYQGAEGWVGPNELMLVAGRR